MKEKSAAALLALFLGGLGVHQFYLGNNTKGIFYLLFCWTFIPAIIAFFEFIIFLAMSKEEFNSKYNKGVQLLRPTYHNTNDNVAEEIQKLYELKINGALTEDEFQYRKKKLLL